MTQTWNPPQYPAPTTPEPTPTRPRWKTPLIAGCAAVTALIAISGGAAAIDGHTTKTTTIVYSLTLYDASCDEVADSGYFDVPGMEFQVRDENDLLIGHGALSPYGQGGSSGPCTFMPTETLSVRVSKLYQVGNPDRGYVTWDGADVVDGRLDAVASMGDLD